MIWSTAVLCAGWYNPKVSKIGNEGHENPEKGFLGHWSNGTSKTKEEGRKEVFALEKLHSQ